MQKKFVTNCVYGRAPGSGEAIYLSVYILINHHGEPLWHENLFLCDVALSSSTNTLKAVASDLLSFVKATGPIGGWRDVTPSQMNGYLHGDLFQSRGLKQSSIQRHVESLKLFFTWLKRKGYLVEIPDFNWSYKHLYRSAPEKISYTISRSNNLNSLYIDDETFDRLLAGVPGKSLFVRARNKLILKFGYYVGTRASEVLHIGKQEILSLIESEYDSSNNIYLPVLFRLQGKGGVIRDAYLPPALCEEIYIYCRKWRDRLEEADGPLFCSIQGRKIKDEKYASTIFTISALNAEVFRAERQGYHRLRKTFGTNLVSTCYEEGRDPWVEVPRRMGHKNVETTKKYIQFDALKNERTKVLKRLAMEEEKYSNLRRRFN